MRHQKNNTVRANVQYTGLGDLSGLCVLTPERHIWCSIGISVGVTVILDE